VRSRRYLHRLSPRLHPQASLPRPRQRYLLVSRADSPAHHHRRSRAALPRGHHRRSQLPRHPDNRRRHRVPSRWRVLPAAQQAHHQPSPALGLRRSHPQCRQRTQHRSLLASLRHCHLHNLVLNRRLSPLRLPRLNPPRNQRRVPHLNPVLNHRRSLHHIPLATHPLSRRNSPALNRRVIRPRCQAVSQRRSHHHRQPEYLLRNRVPIRRISHPVNQVHSRRYSHLDSLLVNRVVLLALSQAPRNPQPCPVEYLLRNRVPSRRLSHTVNQVRSRRYLHRLSPRLHPQASLPRPRQRYLLVSRADSPAHHHRRSRAALPRGNQLLSPAQPPPLGRVPLHLLHPQLTQASELSTRKLRRQAPLQTPVCLS